ncbi:MAG: type II toxin-antitoxin system VapC family toxin [Dehalococcoidia bacterium]|nr:type II toxin-antitoxin system VapC family toxin [Dehalococcoidia bacterium]MCL4232521.1 type II toxin-antitoxin system VapC family toxin [Dehalococcoidia bacterium]NUQ55788.1 type II toxin-antitoxin system VapC family toxin [Dehalococcoidia bacterium]
MNDVVVDSSAILAYLQSEPGMDLVESAVERSGDIIVASINFAEVVSKLVDRGAGETSIRSGLAALDLVVHPLDEALAYAAGLLRASTRSAGLSLGDRACLALGMQLRLPVLTADRSWETLGLPVEIRAIR